jgi:NMD protein affecting ribosome stability and mRNA decay
MIKDRRKDVYRDISTLKELTMCKICGAVFVNGRWTWNEVLKEARKVLCPACRRINDKFPAGNIQIKGDFCRDHKTEILNLIKNIEKLEKTERPMERVMQIREEKAHTSVTTTGIHIARRIGEALSRSYACDLSFQYGDGEKSIRVFCNR